MYREKTIIRLRKHGRSYWLLKLGKQLYCPKLGISRLFRLISTLVQDKGKVYSIDVLIKRRR